MLRDKNKSLLCLQILQKDCSECPSFLNKVRLFLSRKPVDYLPCPKFDMQNIYHRDGQHQVKGHHAKLEVDWTKAVPAWNLLTHPTETSYFVDWQIQATYVPGHKTGKTLHFCRIPLPSSHPALISGRDLENRIASKLGVACSWNDATFPPSLWHGFHYTIDVAFPLSLSSLFSLSNAFFDHLDRLGQHKASSSVLQRHVKCMHWIC